jgi:hypothetical protein
MHKMHLVLLPGAVHLKQLHGKLQKPERSEACKLLRQTLVVLLQVPCNDAWYWHDCWRRRLRVNR